MVQQQSVHPEKAQLAAFLLGKASPAEVEAIEEHLTACGPCCTIAEQIKGDTFVELVQQSLSMLAATAHPNQENVSVDPTETVALTSGDGDGHSATPPALQESPLPASLVGHPRFRVLRLLGQGGMGAVYKAEHRHMERAVALKIINKDLVANESAVERFRREVKAAARLDHPNIVRAFDAEMAGDVNLLVMEYVEGTDLDRVLEKRGPLPVPEACAYIRQAALGLQHAHENGMVHRDIKPHNLMLANNGDVKILDFGLASLTTEHLPSETVAATSEQATETVLQLTLAGSIMGTPDYMAPEQVEDASSADIRADIYSLGCTFYTLLTGKTPFPDGTALDKVRAHVKRDPMPVGELRPEVPGELRQVLQKMMSRDKNDRYQTPGEVAVALAPFTAPETGADFKSVLRRRWPLVTFAGVAATVLFLLSVTIFFVRTPHGTVRIEITDPKIKARFAGKTLTFENRGETITVKPGQHSLFVQRGDLQFETPKFTLGSGKNPMLQVEFLAGQVVVKQGKKELAKREALPSKPNSLPGKQRFDGRRVLVLEPTAGLHEFLVSRLRKAKPGWKVVPMAASGLPQGSEEMLTLLSKFDSVMIANVPADQLNKEQQQALRSNTHDKGCGLIMIGGPQGFGAGGWRGTELEKALPVTCDMSETNVAGKGGVVLIFDGSEVQHGNYYQKTAARQVVTQLSPADHVGVLYFDFRPGWKVPFQQVAGNRARMLKRVNHMLPGDLPDMSQPLKMAADALCDPRHSFASKSIIILSRPDDWQAPTALLKDIAKKGVHITTVCLIPDNNDQIRKMARMAKVTGGRAYVVTNRRDFQLIYTKETRLISEAFLCQSTFRPKRVADSALTKGLGDLKPLHGMVRTKKRPSPLVTMPIVANFGKDKTYPVLAHWQYGKGKVVAFTSDARSGGFGGGWDRDWVKSSMYSRFWSQVVQWSLQSQ